LEGITLEKQIKMLVSMAGVKESFIPGDVLTVSDTIADAWIEAGIAELYEENTKVKKFEPDLTPANPEQEQEPKVTPENKDGDPDGEQISDTTNNGAGDTSGDKGLS
jgi:hypothetical protein